MQRATPLDTSLRSYSAGGSRGVVHKANDQHYLQELKIDMMADETRRKVEHPQNYGFTSVVRKAEQAPDEPEDDNSGPGDNDSAGRKEEWPAAEHFVQFMGGNRSFPVVQNLDDRRVRLRCLEEGEVCVYDDQQQKVHIQRQRILSRSQFRIEQRVVLDKEREDGHGRHKVASRDQTKDKSLRLSTIMMDAETIVMERTKPKQQSSSQQQQGGQDEEWQKGGEKGPDDPEKQIQKCSQIHMSERRVAMTTYRDGEPHLVVEVSEDSGVISLLTLDSGRPRLEFSLDAETGNTNLTNHEAPPDTPGEEPKPGLIFELDDKARRINIMTTREERPQLAIILDGKNDVLTIKTNGKTEQVFDNASSSISIHADSVVRVGDRSADIPAAMLGSVTAMGDIIVGGCAQKVLVK